MPEESIMENAQNVLEKVDSFLKMSDSKVLKALEAVKKIEAYDPDIEADKAKVKDLTKQLEKAVEKLAVDLVVTALNKER